MNEQQSRPWFIFQEMGDQFVRDAVMRAFNDDLRGHYWLETLAYDALKQKWLIKLTKKVLPPVVEVVKDEPELKVGIEEGRKDATRNFMIALRGLKTSVGNDFSLDAAVRHGRVEGIELVERIIETL